MPRPEDLKKRIQRLLGMLSYVSKFIPINTIHKIYLRQFLHKVTKWAWMPEHERVQWFTSWHQLQCCIFFDPLKDIRLSTNASKGGLGAALLQCHGTYWLPISYASWTVTAVEKMYAQTEKKTLGLVYGCTVFHDFLYGFSFKAETDHKPLIAVHKKGLREAQPMIQWLLLGKKQMLWPESGNLNTTYRHSLRSYAPSDNTQPDNQEQAVNIHVNMIKVW